MSTDPNRTTYESDSFCDVCSSDSPLSNHDDKYVCERCVSNWDRAAQALADGAWVMTREANGRLRPRAWIQEHDFEMMRVSYAGARKDQWLDIESIASTEEI